MNLIIDIIKVILLTLYIAFMGQVVFYPIEHQLRRIADFLDSFEVSIEEKVDEDDE